MRAEAAKNLLIASEVAMNGTPRPAEYTASRIAGAKFVGFEQGGHLLVGHDAAVRAAIVDLLKRSALP